MRLALAKTIRSGLGRVAARYEQISNWNVWYRSRVAAAMGLSGNERRSRGIRHTVRLVGNMGGLWRRTIEQTPRGSCQWGETLFVADGDADFYVVLNSAEMPVDNPHLPKVCLPEPARVWAIHMEPEEYIHLLGYDRDLEYSKYSRCYTNSRVLLNKGAPYIASPPYVHFHLRRSWDFLSLVELPEKHEDLAVIVSGLTTLDGHRSRLQFLKRLDDSEVPCEIWGRGAEMHRFRKYRGVAFSKWRVHSRHKYSLVLENSVNPYYWSEKAPDAILSYSLPLYHGGPSLQRHLPKGSFLPIDINDSNCLDGIRAMIDADAFDESIAAINEARRVILDRENVYAFLDRQLRGLNG